jgi:hypothetical protein
MDPRVVTGEPRSTVTVELVTLFAPELLIPPMSTEPGGPLVLTRLTAVIESAADATAGAAAISAMTTARPQTSRPIREK